MTEEEVPNTTFLKAVVIILGILIIGVASVIGVTIFKRAISPESEASVSETPVPDNRPLSSAPVAFGDVTLKTPAGMIPLQVSSSASRLVITYGTDQNSPREVVIVNPGSGEILGRILLKE